MVKILPILSSQKCNLQNEPIAYDDEISQQRRNYIRSHYESWNNGLYQDIYEKEPRLEEYELKKLVKFYSSKPKKINIDNLNIVARKIDYSPKTNIYRGQSLMYSSDADIRSLKDAGFKQVIDFASLGDEYKQRVEKAGLSFYDFYMGNFWNDGVFVDGNSPENNRNYLNKFVKFINKMQDGYAYIGCDFGTYKTDEAVMLNSFFNPKANRHSTVVRYNFMIDKMRTLYENLTSADKFKMKWNVEWEKKFLSMLKRAKSFQI